jgi:methylated-DNA-[protein]-cysteine S-methyltransferase
MIYTLEYESPLGTLTLESDGTALRRIRLPRERWSPDPDQERRLDPVPFAAAVAQLDEYFAGTRDRFDLELAPGGTAFQRRVWARLREIPRGATVTYAELARRVGNPAACRAVGAANGRNPLPIVVPCHRVIGSDGTLTGYAGGLPAKRKLLELEGALPG